MQAGTGSESGRLVGAERVPPRSEDPGVLLATRSRIGVDARAELEVDKPHTTDDRLPPCARQGTGDSAGPEVDIPLRLFRDWLVDAYVGDLDAAAGAERTVDLFVRPELVEHQIEDPV